MKMRLSQKKNYDLRWMAHMNKYIKMNMTFVVIYIYQLSIIKMPLREGKSKLWFKTKEEQVIQDKYRMNSMTKWSQPSPLKAMTMIVIILLLFSKDKEKSSI